MEVTFVDTGGIVIGNPVYRDEMLKFDAADTIAAGTLLARDTSDNTMIPFDPDDSDFDFPSAVLTIESERDAAGNNSVRVLISGKVRREKLLIHNGAEVTIQHVEILRMLDILALAVEEQNILDNN